MPCYLAFHGKSHHISFNLNIKMVILYCITEHKKGGRNMVEKTFFFFATSTNMKWHVCYSNMWRCCPFKPSEGDQMAWTVKELSGAGVRLR